MANLDYDIVTVGGGLGGSAIAKAMAEHGVRVLVLERETQFHDRVRGEALSPWGVAEARALGLDDALQSARANEGRFAIGLGPERDFVTTTPQGLPVLTFYHPAMQEAVLAAASNAGAEVRRGVTVRKVTPGAPASVEFDTGEGDVETVRARLVVGADGRISNARRWGNFTVMRDSDRMMLAGVLLEGGEAYREDAIYFIVNPSIARASFLAPQGNRRFRSYLAYRCDSGFQLRGTQALPQMVAECVRCGVPAQFYANAKIVGPLASFSGADTFVEHPYANGVALIGDAAAASDPSWGQGLSLTLRDVRVLRDVLLAGEDWDDGGHNYASEHDRYYGALHIWEDWFTAFFYDVGEEAERRRAKAFPLILEDVTRMPDYLFSGPDLPLDEGVRQRFYGEE
jgi:2-polyprenyl-6-methoxyphenol hydroxylase-like FAD-dependent oxidoreductase